MFSFSFIESVRGKLSASMEYRQISRGSMRTRELDAILVWQTLFCNGFIYDERDTKDPKFRKNMLYRPSPCYPCRSIERQRERERI